jgi:antitoxin (DNA-binding transcriptional repressor) of toxin-antitoxin stability system
VGNETFGRLDKNLGIALEMVQIMILCICVHIDVHFSGRIVMAAHKVGVREFRERIASFLESDKPVAVTRRGETLGVYVPTPRRRRKSADLSELKAAADRLAQALGDVDEEEFVEEFKQMRRRGKASAQ